MSPSTTELAAHNGSPHTHSHNNIATHIRDLLPLPRHAVFHVHLVIHQLQSVPLMSGEFRIKWKFRNLQTVNSAGRPLGLGRALALKMDAAQKKKQAEQLNTNGKGKEKEVAEGEELPDELHEMLGLPADPPHTPPVTERPESTHSGQSSFNSISNSKHSTRSSNSNSKASTPPSENGPGIDYRSEALGYTPFLPLREYKVDFGYHLDAAVQMSVEKDSLALLPSELKLTVMQRVISGDPEAPLNPRLGHVEVNLAEYADAGSVTRSYLLRRSKVNAMLNMTLTVSHISGESHYHPPPLRKEEIKAGISEFLSMSATPLPALNRFMPTEDPWLAQSLEMFVPTDDPEEEAEEEEREDENALEVPRTKKRWRVGANSRPSSAGKKSNGNGIGSESRPPSRKNSKQQRQRQQLHPTEALIEAIFNPYPSTSTAASPFTYYVPPAPAPDKEASASDKRESEGTGTGTEGTSRGSFDSSEQGHDASGNSGGGNRWWRRRRDAGSRPVTPARTNSTRS